MHDIPVFQQNGYIMGSASSFGQNGEADRQGRQLDRLFDDHRIEDERRVGLDVFVAAKAIWSPARL